MKDKHVGVSLLAAALSAGFAYEGEAKLSYDCASVENVISTSAQQIDLDVKDKTGGCLLQNKHIKDVLQISVPYLIGAMPAVETQEPYVGYFVTNGSTCIRFQVQVPDGVLVKGCVLEMFQKGVEVHVRKLWSMYYNTANEPFPSDMLREGFNYTGKSDESWNYRPEKFDVTVRTESLQTIVHVQPTLDTTTEKLIRANARLEDLRALGPAPLKGNISLTVPPVVCFERRIPGRYEFQLQVKDGTNLKGSQYVFFQRGADIYGYKVNSWWVSTDRYPEPGVQDFSAPDFVPTGSNPGGSYYLDEADLFFCAQPMVVAPSEEVNAAAETGLVIEIGRNGVLSLDGSVNPLSAEGKVDVSGILSATTSGRLGESAVNVFTGGLFVVKGAGAIQNGYAFPITLDGGAFTALDAESYLNTPVFKNGACAFGGEVRVGTRDVTWQVCGSAPSSSDLPIRCVSSPTRGEFTLTWQVADVTGDEAVDFRMNAGMTDFQDGATTQNGGMIHRKTGAGTLRWGGVSTCTGAVQIAEGTLVLGRSNALNPGDLAEGQWAAKQALDFCGGTLSEEAGVTNSVSRLGISAGTSALVLEAGASLSADAFDGVTGSGTLAVTLADDAEFRIGTAACLTRAQLRAIRVNGRRALQDEAGRLTAAPLTGLMMLVR